MDREYPQYAIAAVGCVVIRNDEILLVKRGYPPRTNYWSIPGGVIEAGETLYEAAIRELEEETGLTGKPSGILAVADVSLREGDRVRYRYVIVDVYFDPYTIRGSIRPGGDALDVKWFKLDRVVEREDITGSTKRLVKMIIDHGLHLIEVV